MSLTPAIADIFAFKHFLALSRQNRVLKKLGQQKWDVNKEGRRPQKMQ